MAAPVPNQRVISIDSIRRGLPNICPDEYLALLRDNRSAKLDPCLIETVKKLYDKFFVNCPPDLSKAFYNFRLKDCSAYLQKKIAELQSNAEQIASTVKDISDADRETYILIAERIQDLVFVSKFVSRQHLVKENHTCLSSIAQLEGELRSLHEKVAREPGVHHLSLAQFEKIERDLRTFKKSIDKDDFDSIAKAAEELDRDLIS